MKKLLIFISTAFLFGSCVTINQYNRNLTVPKNEEQLKSDVDYTYHKLQQLHPALYWYTSKQSLDFKFDSLKTTINAPMTSNEFYLKIAPVVAEVKQGHTRLSPLKKKLKPKEAKAQKKIGPAPLSQFDYEVIDHKLYIVKNNSADSTINIGTEVMSVNDNPPGELISKYSKTFASDGYNKTFIERRSGKDFPAFFFYQNGRTDSVSCRLRYNDSIRTVCVKRLVKDNPPKVEKTDTQKTVDKAKQKAEAKKQKLQGYNKETKAFSKSLSFPGKDSTVALLKIRDFSRGDHKKFYKNTFNYLDSLKIQTLIIDLRDNPGGALADALDLNSYLTDTSFYFTEKSEVVSRTSLLHTNYFRGKPIYTLPLLVAFSPLRLVAMGVKMVKTSKATDGKFYYSFNGTKPNKCKPNHFKGDVYVLINGGSFSAACIVSSNLKGSKRAIFVGEETGGAYNGTVAGQMANLILPESKLPVRIGLAVIKPHYHDGIEGRGIMPDVEIKPTLADRMKGVDPELEWVLKKVTSDK